MSEYVIQGKLERIISHKFEDGLFSSTEIKIAHKQEQVIFLFYGPLSQDYVGRDVLVIDKREEQKRWFRKPLTFVSQTIYDQSPDNEKLPVLKAEYILD